MKKIISIVLTVFMLTAMFATAIAVNAADGLQIKVATVEADPGDTVDVTIDFVGVTTLASTKAKVTWDENLTLVAAEYNCLNAKDKNAMVNEPEEYDDDDNVVWTGVTSPYIFNWIQMGAKFVLKEDAPYVTLTFEVADDAEGLLPITIEIDGEDVFTYDEAGESVNVPFTTENGGVQIKEPEPNYNGRSIDRFVVGGVDVAAKDEGEMEVGSMITALGWASFKDGLKEVYWTVNGTKQACEDNYRDRPDVAGVVPGTYNNGEHAGFGKDDKYMDLTGTDALAAGVYSLSFVAVSNSGEEQTIKLLSLTVKEKEPEKLAIVVSDAEVTAGETVDVTIELKNVAELASVKVAVEWPEELELQSAVYNCLNEKDKNALVHEPEDEDWTTVSGSYTFNWITMSKQFELKADGAFVTLTFKAADDAAEGEYAVTATVADEDDIFCYDEDEEEVNVPFTVEDGAVKINAKVVEPEDAKIINTCVDTQTNTGDGKLAAAGWTGSNYPTKQIGYTVDGGEPVWSGIEMTQLGPDDPVLQPANAGQYGFRYNANLDLTDLAEGEHEIVFVIMVDDGEDSVLPIRDAFKVNVPENSGEQSGEDTTGEDNPPIPPTGDVAIIAVAAVACIALAGAVIGKNALKK